MTQARKEQVKNLKTRYTRFDQVGSLVIGGGSETQIINNTAFLPNYDQFLSSTNTKVVGGAETSAPAIIYGGFGPFNIASGASLNIIIKNVNNNQPILVQFTTADLVNLGGVPVLTTSKAVNKINSILSVYGVATPFASNIDGQLVLMSSDVGDTYITLTNVTSGILNSLGFTTSNSITGTGTVSPQRGIITTSSDGLGGYVRLRNIDTSVSQSVNNYMVHSFNRTYVPSVVPGQPAYARIRAFPGADLNGKNFRIDFYRNGPLKPNIITSQSSFSLLGSSDTVNFSINYGTNIGTVNFSVTFGTITTVQQVVDAINAGFAASTLGSYGVESTRASIKVWYPGPYTLMNNIDSFFISFNNNPVTVNINPPTSTYSATGFVAYINAQILAAGLSSEGRAVLTGSSVVIESLSTDGTLSSVTIYPGNPGLTTPGTSMSTLNALGIVPGTYKANYVATKYGNDEIKFICQSCESGANLTMTGSTTTLSKLGLSTSGVNVSVVNGVDKAQVPVSQTLIPEMVEFSEETDNHETEVQSFDTNGSHSVKAQDGVKNVGLEGLFSNDGKIDTSLISSIFTAINANKINLGANSIDTSFSTSKQLSPRVETPHDPTYGPVLLWSGPSLSGSDGAIVRMYLFNGAIYITTNAYVNGSGGVPLTIYWARDNAVTGSSMLEWVDGKASQAHISYSTWDHTQWNRTIKTNTTGVGGSVIGGLGTYFGSEITKLGEGLTSTVANCLLPRVEVSPATTSSRILFAELKASSAGGSRVYIYSDASYGCSIELAFNTYWNGSQFVKDVSGLGASLYAFAVNNATVYRRQAANNAPWNSWDIIESNLDSENAIQEFAGTLNLGTNLGGDGATSRLKAVRASAVFTLLFESPQGSSTYSSPIRIYMGNNDYGSINGFAFTVNARWDEPTASWIQDNYLSRSSMLMIHSYTSSASTMNFFSKNAGSSPWTIVAWDETNQFNTSGLFIARGSDSIVARPTKPAANDATVEMNTLYASTLVKSWGRVRYFRTGPSIEIIDGFNIASSTTYGGSSDLLKTNYATSIGNGITPYSSSLANGPTVITTVDFNFADGTTPFGSYIPVSTVFRSEPSFFIHFLTMVNGSWIGNSIEVIVNHVTYVNG